MLCGTQKRLYEDNGYCTRCNLQVCCIPMCAEQPVTAHQHTAIHPGACLSVKDAVPLLLNRGVSHWQDYQSTHSRALIINIRVFNGDEYMSYLLIHWEYHMDLFRNYNFINKGIRARCLRDSSKLNPHAGPDCCQWLVNLYGGYHPAGAPVNLELFMGAHRAAIKTEGLICCSSQGSQKTKRSKTAVTFSIISILCTITHCVPALSAKADIACLWHKTTWCWAGSDRHTPGKFPFWQVAHAFVSFLLLKAYAYLTSVLDNCPSPYLAEKLRCQNWDFQQETRS